MNSSIIIHCVKNGTGGIGDFIRSSISFYVFSKKNNLKYYIDFSNYKYFNECFELEKIPEINNYPFEELYIMNVVGKIEDKILNKLINKSKVYYIYTNSFGFIDNQEINNYIYDYFKIVLKPSKKVENYIEKIYNEFNLKENNYVSFHLRCGDKIMCMNNEENKNLTHVLFNIDNHDEINNLKKYIEIFMNKFNLDLPIIIHSDSQILKKKLKDINDKLIIINNQIRHNSVDIGINTEESNIQTVGEFYLIAKSYCILSKTYSGFSHYASLVYNKKLYTELSHHSYYKLLNRNNIYNV